MLTFEAVAEPWTTLPLATEPPLGSAHRWLHDLPELRRAERELRAAALRHAGLADAIEANGEPADWGRVLLAQVSPHRYVRHLRDQVQIVATPRYRARGSDGPFNRSAVLVRADDPAWGLEGLRGRRGSISGDDMNSAMLFSASAAGASHDGRFFGSVTRYPTWPLALDGLLEGDVDAAVLDGVMLALLGRYRPAMMDRLRVLLWTTRSPGPPLVTSRWTPPDVVERLREGLLAVEADEALAEARNALLIEGFNQLGVPHYRAALHLEQIADSLNYAELR